MLRKMILLTIAATTVSSLTASESPLKTALKPTKADRRVLHNCPNDAIFFNEPKPLQRDSNDKINGLRLDGTIEVNSDITTNQIWTANNIYHITANISVQALLVIEPGTTVKYATDRSMAVNNGGVLISAGTPDNLITYTSDSPDPWYGDYNCPILIEETASASTKVTYSYIEYAFYGIEVVNNRLDSPIENNYFYKNALGIIEYGTEHTDIINNLFYSTYYYAIDVNLASVTSQGNADSHILIQNNTCHFYQDVGILVRGVSNPDEAGQATLKNNIVSGSYQYGIALVNDYMYYDLINTGYYDNEADKYDDYEEVNPVIETTLPYVDGTGTLPICYLNPNSAFVNASDEYIEQTRLIGKTTDINSFPDSNKTDLGFHYTNWNFSNAGATTLYADFDNSYAVDFNDLSAFADYWLYDYNYNYACWWWDWFNDGVIDFYDLDAIMDYWLSPYDFSDFSDFAHYWRRQVDYRFEDKRFDLVIDNFVDFRDFSKFAEQWNQETTSTDPNIQIQISGDPNNGYVDISVAGWLPDTMQIFLLANGKYIGRIPRFKDGEPLTIDISEFGSGQQQIKLASADSNSHITCSNINNVEFSRPLNYCFLPENYLRNHTIPFAAYNPTGGNSSVKVYANGGNMIWSQTFSGNSVSGFIPAEILDDQNDVDYVSFDDINGQSVAKKITVPKEPNNFDVRALIITPAYGMNILDYRTINEVKKAFKNKGIIYEELFGQYATYDNIAWYGWHGVNIKYIYLAAHGSYFFEIIPGYYVPRTWVSLYDYDTVSMKKSDFVNPADAPPWCENLWYWENQTRSFLKMRFNTLEFVYFNTCYGARLKILDNTLTVGERGEVYDFDAPQSDMSLALGISESSRTRFYQSWYDKSSVNPFLLWDENYQQWNRDEWQFLGEGENLYWAIFYTIQRQTHFGPLDPANNYTLRGQGSLMDIVLRNW